VVQYRCQPSIPSTPSKSASPASEPSAIASATARLILTTAVGTEGVEVTSSPPPLDD
jgi:hypothetical protein